MMAEYENFRSQSQVLDLDECSICGRKFMPESLLRHEPVCAKTAEKKRKAFDSSKQRIQGTDIPTVKVAKTKPEKEILPKRNNWRQKHAEFVNTLQAARGVKNALENGLPLPPPPPPAANPDYVQCPTCNRRFSETAAQRHIDFCAEQSRRIPVKKEASQESEQRNMARTQYKAPKLKGKVQSADAHRQTPLTGNLVPSGTSQALASKRNPGSGREVSARDEGDYSGDRRKARKPDSGYVRQPVSASDGGGHAGPALNGNGRAELIAQGMGQSRISQKVPSPGSGRPPHGSLHSGGGGSSGIGSASSAPGSSGHRMTSAGSGNRLHINSSTGLPPSEQLRRGAAVVPPKFCHDCGSRYCRETAKYCCECGMRKLEL